jgi:lipopolysaccharide biosynthesis regulator YciM
LRRAIELKPECVEAHDTLGRAYLKSGDRAGAVEQLRILKGLDPEFESVLNKQLESEISGVTS